MIPLRLSLRGITKFEDLDLDLSGIEPGLVAVVGGNGQGKTTILEAMLPGALYRQMPSRPGTLTGVANRRDARIEVDLDYAGARWTAKVLVDPEFGGGRGKQEGFLLRDGEPLVSGRVTDYDEAVARVFPSRDVVLASAFASQGRAGNFLDLATAERKALFARLLGLEAMQSLADRAAAHRRPYDARAKLLEDRASRLAEDEAAAVSLRSELELNAAAVGRHRANLASAEAAYTVAGDASAKARAEATQLAAAVEAARSRLAAAQAARTAAAGRLARVTADLEAARAAAAQLPDARDRAARLASLQEQIAGLRADAEGRRAAVAGLRDRVASLREQRSRAAADLEQARGALAAAGAVAADLERLEAEHAAADAAHTAAADAWTAAKATVDELLRAPAIPIDKARAAVERARRLLSDAEDRAARLGTVPCRGLRALIPKDPTDDESDLVEADCGSCLLIADARSGADAIPGLKDAVSVAEAELRQLTAEQQAHAEKVDAARAAQEAALQPLVAARTAAAAAERAVVGARATIAAAEHSRAVLDRAASLVAELDADLPAAIRQHDDERAAFDRVVEDGKRLASGLDGLAGAAEIAARLEAAAARVDGLVADLAAATEDAEAAERALEASAADTPPSAAAAEAALERAKAAHTAAARDRDAAAASLRDAEAIVARTQGRLDQLGDLAGRRAQLEDARARCSVRRAGWALIEKGLGRDGVQALEIDAAGPQVSGLVNDLLEACYGPRFRVRLITVQEGGGGRVQREVFDLRVLDGASGGERSHGDLSGGEQVLIDEALKLGIAVFNAQRSGAAIGTLWRDECDGRLDTTNAAAYPGMLRSAMALGGFRNVYFITHRPEVWSQADVVLHVADGGVRVRSPSDRLG